MWVVYSVGVGLVQDLACVMLFGVVGRLGKCFYVYMRIVICRFMVSYYVCGAFMYTIYVLVCM